MLALPTGCQSSLQISNQVFISYKFDSLTMVKSLNAKHQDRQRA